MRILSAKDMDVAVVSKPLMLEDADLERAGNGAGVILYSPVAVAIMGTIICEQSADHTSKMATRYMYEGSTVAGGDLELSGVCGGSHRPPLRTFLACAILPVPPKFGCWSQRLEAWRRTATTICPSSYLVSANTRS